MSSASSTLILLPLKQDLRKIKWLRIKKNLMRSSIVQKAHLEIMQGMKKTHFILSNNATELRMI